jgi:WD repeat-containing protein 19
LPLEIEPSFLAIGKYHLACGMNNHIWYYDLGRVASDQPMLLGDREYMAEIKQVSMNGDHVAVLCGGQIMLHTVGILGILTKAYFQSFRSNKTFLLNTR